MKGFRRLATALGVACACPAFTFAFAQDQKAAAPVGGATVIKVEVKAAPANVKTVKTDAAQEKEEKKADVAVEKTVEKAATPAVKMVVAPADANLAPMIAQFTNQYRPFLRSELQFVRSVCEPTKEQRKEIVRDGEAALADAMKRFAVAQQRGRQGFRVGFQVAQNEPMSEPRFLIQSGLATAMRKHLSAEQLARYQEEVAKRNEDRKGLAVRNLVSRMDEDLVLTAEQRDKLCEAMLKNYNENWLGTVEVIANNPQYFPAIPDKVIVPILNKAQKKVWEGTQKISGGNFNGFNMRNMFGGVEELDMLGD